MNVAKTMKSKAIAVYILERQIKAVMQPDLLLYYTVAVPINKARISKKLSKYMYKCFGMDVATELDSDAADDEQKSQ